MKALEESLENSNKMLVASSTDIMMSLENKLKDPATHEKANYWYPRAQVIQKISKEAIDHIEKRKLDIYQESKSTKSIFENDSLNLYKMLIDYKTRLLQVDPKLNIQFKNSLKVFTQAIDSLNDNQSRVFKRYLNVSKPAMNAMLTKLQNNVRFNEQRMIAFCNENCASTIWRIRYGHQPIVVQSSTIVQAGEQIEIISGLAFFSIEQKPNVFVYGKPSPLGEDGVAHYKFKAASKSGKYFVPVKINYIDQDGRQVTVQKEIEYTVANIEKQ